MARYTDDGIYALIGKCPCVGFSALRQECMRSCGPEGGFLLCMAAVCNQTQAAMATRCISSRGTPPGCAMRNVQMPTCILPQSIVHFVPYH